MKAVATMKLKIPYREELLETMRQYSNSAQKVTDIGFEKHLWNKVKLHNLTYYNIKNSTQLPAQLICSSRNKACETLKAVFKNKGSKPKFKEFLTIRYDARSFSFKPDIISLCSVNGRLKMPIKIPEYYKQYLSWKICSADLIYDKKKRFFLHVVVAKDVNANTSSRSNGKIVGIDVGINNLAVTSERKFFNGKKIKRVKLHFRKLRTKLQAKGTPASKRLLKHISGREKRFMAWTNHNISKGIVSNLNARDTVVMEKIKGIRKQRKGGKFNFWLNSWSFYQLQKFIEYKAIRKGCRVIYVKARNTSKQCSRCSSLHSSRSKSFFKCLHCGYSLNADLNASYNLAKSHSIADGISAVVNQPYLMCNDAEASQMN